ncbi:DUF6230 family protein [Nonomuraea aurantiaca]|uniref:DUF6230 family protein n=1 Tax=Nonomuraea aurantiaca TaxID=2878562 RepID=UPI001CD9A622|nr:DUF6230 family protein [Nonomuraea aurantiaca]MCA2229722.1 DUF6230 family protein [Nonomuraea aurantiaca]
MPLKYQGRNAGHLPRASLRWGRFAATLAASLTVTGALLVAISQGTLAASFAVSGRDMKVSANRIEGNGYVTYPAVVTSADGRKHPVTVVAVNAGRVWGLCQSSQIATPLGRFVLRLSSPAQAGSVRVSDLRLSATSVSADLNFGKLQINRDAASLDAVPGVVGALGDDGLQAIGFTVENVKARSWAVISGSLQAQGTRLAIGRTEPECF